MRWQRMVAWFDRFISSLFHLSSHGSSPGNNGAASTWSYFGSEGPRVTAVCSDGDLEIGGRWQVYHDLDKDGKLLRRYGRWKVVPPGTKLYYGWSECVRLQQEREKAQGNPRKVGLIN